MNVKLIINNTSSTFSKTLFFTVIKAYTQGIQKVIKPSIKTGLLIKFISIGETGKADSFCGFGRAQRGASINSTQVLCGKNIQFGERLSRGILTIIISAELLFLRKSNRFALNQTRWLSQIYIKAFSSTLFYTSDYVYWGKSASIHSSWLIFTMYSFLCSMLYQFNVGFFHAIFSQKHELFLLENQVYHLRSRGKGIVTWLYEINGSWSWETFLKQLKARI